MINWSEKDLADFARRQGGENRLTFMGLSPERLKRLRGPNKGEIAYGKYLKLGMQIPDPAGRLVTWCAFEAIKIRVGTKCWLTPDYLVEYDDRCLELHDVKGAKNGSYYAKEDAVVKARAVAAHYPIPLFFVFPVGRTGEWQKVRM